MTRQSYGRVIFKIMAVWRSMENSHFFRQNYYCRIDMIWYDLIYDEAGFLHYELWFLGFNTIEPAYVKKLTTHDMASFLANLWWLVMFYMVISVPRIYMRPP